MLLERIKTDFEKSELSSFAFAICVTLSLLIFSSCSSVQILYTDPSTSNIKTEDDKYVYENDTLKIVYAFWEAGGVMAFTIENKLDIPIYIDWKKSSFINVKIKANYYSENEITQSKSEYAYAPFLYRNVYDWGRWYPITLGISESESIKYKDERIMFIPPHSVTNRAKFKIVSTFVTMNNATKQYIDNSNKIKGLVLETTKDKSMLFFRNFLTYSTKESFEKEQYINNEFYVRKVIELAARHLDEMAKPSRFYIPLDTN